MQQQSKPYGHHTSLPTSISEEISPCCTRAPVYGMLGLCVKAGKAILGVPLILQAARSGKSGRRKLEMVFLCTDASPNTCKRIKNGCHTYEIPCYPLPLTGEQAGKAVGKSGLIMAIGITDAGMARALYEKVYSNKNDTDI